MPSGDAVLHRYQRWVRKLALPLIIMLVPLAVAVPAAADPDLVFPWPDNAVTEAPDGRPVTFPSHSPFALSDVGAGPDENPPTTAQGTLFLPPAATAANPAPAVVLLHGASGVQSARELTYARQFAGRGVAALVVDVFGPRRERGSGFVERLLNITEAMFLADAFSALRFLDARPEIDGARVALMGFSYGGMAATFAAYAQVAETFARHGERFAAHVAFYAPCIAEFEDGRATGAPLLMLFGGRDAIVDPKRCAQVAEQLRGGGSPAKTVVYPNAVHQWDGRFGAERKIGRNLAGCRFVVERDGTVRERQLWVPMSGPFLRKMMLGLCGDSEGYLIGRNDEIRARSNRDMGAFLERAFKKSGG